MNDSIITEVPELWKAWKWRLEVKQLGGAGGLTRWICRCEGFDVKKIPKSVPRYSFNFYSLQTRCTANDIPQFS